MSDGISRRQMTAAVFVATLSTLIRRFPRVSAETAGRTGWLSPLLAAVPLALVFLVLWLFYRRRPEGTGFAEILTDIFGGVPGKLLTGLYGLWILLYAGFLLRSGADRFVSMVFPSTRLWLFIAVMALACLPAAMGRIRSIVRSALLFRPLLVTVFVLVFLLTLKLLNVRMLLPVTRSDLLPNSVAALKTTNAISGAFYLIFLSGRLEGRLVPKDYLGWAVTLLCLLSLMTASSIGLFGAALAGKMSFPFFMLARDVVVLGAVERLEPVVIAVWVLSDFVLLSLLPRIAAENFRFCFSLRDTDGHDPARSLRHGRWLIPVCVLLMAVGALCLSGDAADFGLLSDTVVPWINVGFSFGLPLLALLVGAMRRRI